MEGRQVRFSMLKISSSKQSDGDYQFESMIMEKGASAPWKNTFESEFEMVSIMTDILARQKRDRDTRHVLNRIHGGEHYFFDLDLTEEQAETLGWQPAGDVDMVGAV
jgi:hypothetical protein